MYENGDVVYSLVKWNCVSVLINYFALLKTRLIINYLIKSGWSSITVTIVAISDFVVWFIVYSLFLVLCTIIQSHLSGFPLPFFSAETALLVIAIIAYFITLTNPGAEQQIITQHHMDSHVFSLFHSDFFPTLIALMLALQLIPNLTVASVFFYASMMPSIWLWAFFLTSTIAMVLKMIDFVRYIIIKYFDAGVYTLQMYTVLATLCLTFIGIFIIIMIITLGTLRTSVWFILTYLSYHLQHPSNHWPQAAIRANHSRGAGFVVCPEAANLVIWARCNTP